MGQIHLIGQFFTFYMSQCKLFNGGSVTDASLLVSLFRFLSIYKLLVYTTHGFLCTMPFICFESSENNFFAFFSAHFALFRSGLWNYIGFFVVCDIGTISAHHRLILFPTLVASVDMERVNHKQEGLLEKFSCLIRKCIFSVLSVGPIPGHIAFIMDGNRRYAKKNNLLEVGGHRAGFSALTNMLRYCYELGVKYITVYALSIDNFKRCPEEVQSLMKLMQEKIYELVEEESIVNRLGIRIYFQGNLELLSDHVRSTVEMAMAKTAGNSKAVLSVCVAYTATDEIVHAVQESCEEKWDEIRERNASNDGSVSGLCTNYEIEQPIGVTDIDRHMYMSVVPDPDIIVRSSGEMRLSNFLLWQSANCLLYSPRALWPEIGFWHLVWAAIDFQRNYLYLKEKKKVL